jgi:hypothetical protein
MEDEADEELGVRLVEACEAPLVVDDNVLCSAGFAGLERPDSEEEGLEVEVPEDDSDEEAVLVTLPLSEPLAEVGALPVDDAPTFGSDQQRRLASWLDGIVTGSRHRRGASP